MKQLYNRHLHFYQIPRIYFFALYIFDGNGLLFLRKERKIPIFSRSDSQFFLSNCHSPYTHVAREQNLNGMNEAWVVNRGGVEGKFNEKIDSKLSLRKEDKFNCRGQYV